MNKPEISKDFTLDDIRKVRDYNSARHLEMTSAERQTNAQEAVSWFRTEMDKRHSKKITLV